MGNHNSHRGSANIEGNQSCSGIAASHEGELSRRVDTSTTNDLNTHTTRINSLNARIRAMDQIRNRLRTDYGYYNDEDLLNCIENAIQRMSYNSEEGYQMNLDQLIADYNYVPDQHSIDLIRPLSTVEILTLKPMHFGYKIVCIKVAGQINMNCAALLELSIHRVACSNTGSFLSADQIQRGSKYCTDRAIPVKAWIFGEAGESQKIHSLFLENKCELVSNFNPNFRYALAHESIELNYGSRGKGCVQGIHFFPDFRAAIRYLFGTRFIDLNNILTPVMTGSIEASEQKNCDNVIMKDSLSTVSQSAVAANQAPQAELANVPFIPIEQEPRVVQTSNEIENAMTDATIIRDALRPQVVRVIPRNPNQVYQIQIANAINSFRTENIYFAYSTQLAMISHLITGMHRKYNHAYQAIPATTHLASVPSAPIATESL